MDFINRMQELNLDIASEYLVMAAELMKIKSSLLLPNNDVFFSLLFSLFLNNETLLLSLLLPNKDELLSSLLLLLLPKRDVLSLPY